MNDYRSKGGVLKMEFFILLLTPLMGMFLFLTCITFLEKLKENKNTHNQKVLGSVFTFIFIILFFYSLIIVLS